MNKADSFFRDQMKNRVDYFTRTFERGWLISELDAVFPNTDCIPELAFQNRFEVDEFKQNVVDLYKEGIMTLPEARREFNLEDLKPEEMNVLSEEKAFRKAMADYVELAEKYQDGEISGQELVEQVREAELYGRGLEVPERVVRATSDGGNERPLGVLAGSLRRSRRSEDRKRAKLAAKKHRARD